MRRQVLPLSLSVDFLRLVLAVIDDHARSQGQDAGATAGKAGACASPTFGSDVDVSLQAPAIAGADPDVSQSSDDESTGQVYATASCLLSVDDLPRLYHGPGAIVRKMWRACFEDECSGEVSIYSTSNGHIKDLEAF